MNKKEIEEICEYFKIDFNKMNQIGYSNPYGNFISKIDILFKTYKKSFLKASIINERFIFNYFKNNYKIGRKQTWNYIYHGLFFFGLINDRDYKDWKITNGIEIPEFTKFNSLKEYLNSSDALKNIRRNFKKDKIWFQKLIIGSIYHISIKNNLKNLPFDKNSITNFLSKKYDSKYENLFEYVYFAVKKNTLEITQNDKLLLDAFVEKNKLSIKDKNEIKELLKSNSKELKKIQSLRYNFVRGLESEFDDYEKEMLDVIGKYAKTFDINIKMTKTDKAHIIPVWYLVQQKRWDDIANPNNGLILDPNTHRLFDKDKKTTLKGYKIYNEYHEFIIDKSFLNSERKMFIKEWIEKESILK